MIRHIAIFQFNNDKISNEWIIQIKTGLETLVDKIPELSRMEVGINVNSAEKQHLVLTADVDTLEALEIYATHPAHLEVAKQIKPKAVLRTCVDYEL